MNPPKTEPRPQGSGLKEFLSLLLVLLLALPVTAAEHHGTVKFGGLPVPGATVTASQGGKRVTTLTTDDGAYAFPELADGTWSMEVEMQLFSKAQRDVGVSAGAPGVDWDLKILSNEELARAAHLFPSSVS